MGRQGSIAAVLVAALIVGWAARPAAAQSADNVLVVINEDSPDSIAVGEYYVNARAIASDHVARIRTPTQESVTYQEYVSTIEVPVAQWLSRHSLQDRVLYVVLTKGVPLRVIGTGGREGTVSSVDSELTLLYRKLVGSPTTSLVGRQENPYFLGEAPIADAKPFSRLEHDIYLVTRLDGFTVADATALVDRARAASSATSAGRVVLDQRAQLFDPGGDRWLRLTAERLESSYGLEAVMLEVTKQVAEYEGAALGYYSWGSNDGADRRRGSGLTFAPGALAGMFVSTDGRTFKEPPADWLPGPSTRGPSMFGSGSQSIVGDLIREGVTGASAHVEEPYLDATIRPQVLFPAYRAGLNLAEAFYLGMPFLSWQTIVLGDPLCAPFRTESQTLSASAIHQGDDPETGLPALFLERRLGFLTAGGMSREALKLTLRAGLLTLREQAVEAEALSRKAVALEPRLTGVALELAGKNEQRGEYDEAIALYRGVLAVQPEEPMALNNLAYALAVRKNAPREALAYARTAYRKLPTPAVADTLAWVLHLLGDHAAAKPLIEQAVTQAPKNVEILVHAAFIHAAVGEKPTARANLDAAVKLDETIAARDDVRELRKALGGGLIE